MNSDPNLPHAARPTPAIVVSCPGTKDDIDPNANHNRTDSRDTSVPELDREIKTVSDAPTDESLLLEEAHSKYHLRSVDEPSQQRRSGKGPEYIPVIASSTAAVQGHGQNISDGTFLNAMQGYSGHHVSHSQASGYNYSSHAGVPWQGNPTGYTEQLWATSHVTNMWDSMSPMNWSPFHDRPWHPRYNPRSLLYGLHGVRHDVTPTNSLAEAADIRSGDNGRKKKKTRPPNQKRQEKNKKRDEERRASRRNRSSENPFSEAVSPSTATVASADFSPITPLSEPSTGPYDNRWLGLPPSLSPEPGEPSSGKAVIMESTEEIQHDFNVVFNVVDHLLERFTDRMERLSLLTPPMKSVTIPYLDDPEEDDIRAIERSTTFPVQVSKRPYQF
ncbi:hypothetical protein NA57DRAFT_80530 [Rhizodiscina lignyota]|uniref:Uncharacterized protein n=1 Tax=Rhizodiscina lignyota TaxID=1504668 RepID=A0A9P4I997_9PEZI|nr:hypothetical protein NA57DRAFT_80530 [Rhizodiscina lignyota]